MNKSFDSAQKNHDRNCYKAPDDNEDDARDEAQYEAEAVLRATVESRAEAFDLDTIGDRDIDDDITDAIVWAAKESVYAKMPGLDDAFDEIRDELYRLASKIVHERVEGDS